MVKTGRLSRRRAMQAVGGVASAVALGGGVRVLAPLRASAAVKTEVTIASELGLPPEMIPAPDLGHTELAVYVPETGHTVRGLMLEFWRATGASSVLGHPITEPFASPEGYYSQAFENGITVAA